MSGACTLPAPPNILHVRLSSAFTSQTASLQRNVAEATVVEAVDCARGDEGCRLVPSVLMLFRG